MKRAELVVDADYFHCTASMWKEGLPHHKVTRIRITDTGMWVPVEVPKWRPDTPPYRRSDESQGLNNRGFVLGVEVEEDGTLGRQHCVSLIHLRGPWEETRALVADVVRRRQEVEQRQQEATEQGIATAKDVAQQLRLLGMSAFTDLGLPGYVKVKAEDVAGLLEKYGNAA